MSDHLSDAFKALGHPHRLAIVQRLIDETLGCEEPSAENCDLDPARCGFASLAENLGIGKSTVSHHLKVLRQAGLIDRVREGRRVYCSVNQDRLAELREILSLSPTKEAGSCPG